MKATELRKKSEAQLHDQLAQLRAQLAELHRDRFVVETKNVRLAASLRKDIARSMTVLRSLQDNATRERATDKPKKAKES
jgi:ribosomal protein L29